MSSTEDVQLEDIQLEDVQLEDTPSDMEIDEGLEPMQREFRAGRLRSKRVKLMEPGRHSVTVNSRVK